MRVDLLRFSLGLGLVISLGANAEVFNSNTFNVPPLFGNQAARTTSFGTGYVAYPSQFASGFSTTPNSFSNAGSTFNQFPGSYQTGGYNLYRLGNTLGQATSQYSYGTTQPWGGRCGSFYGNCQSPYQNSSLYGNNYGNAGYGLYSPYYRNSYYGRGPSNYGLNVPSYSTLRGYNRYSQLGGQNYFGSNYYNYRNTACRYNYGYGYGYGSTGYGAFCSPRYYPMNQSSFGQINNSRNTPINVNVYAPTIHYGGTTSRPVIWGSNPVSSLPTSIPVITPGTPGTVPTTTFTANQNVQPGNIDPLRFRVPRALTHGN